KDRSFRAFNIGGESGRLHCIGMCKQACCRSIGEAILLLRILPAANGELLGFIAFSPTYDYDHDLNGCVGSIPDCHSTRLQPRLGYCSPFQNPIVLTRHIHFLECGTYAMKFRETNPALPIWTTGAKHNGRN
ncbi:hypothetical protein, partial [Methylobacter sp.]|uniref:hypothetical protein n=1 Tax=Methylobacter sp. TaxID=2051955 RepID=UPI002FDE9342